MEINFSNQNGKRIAINEKSKVQFVEIESITHLKCEGYLTTLYTTNSNTIKVCKQLKKFDEELVKFGFVKANRSTLVNLAQVKHYEGGCKRNLELLNGEIISVSRRNVFIFKNNKSISFQ
jgi:two-component system LytT family response regulator